jgi:hypothetical protein
MRALLIALAALALAAPAAQAKESQFMVFEANRELRSHDGAERAAALDEIQRFGVGWLRVVLYWRDVAPSPTSDSAPSFDESNPASYDWTTYERIVAEARARGMRLLITPSGPAPDWATLAGDGTDYPSPTRFRRFMTAVGRQFGSRVSYWSIWNEPNHPQFLGPQYRNGKPYSPGLYRKLFWAAHGGLADSGNGTDRVLMGETAPRGNSNVVYPLAFLRGALCLNTKYRKRSGCSRLPADGYAHHPYTTSSGPYFVSRRRDDVTIGSISRLGNALYRAERARALPRRTPIYLTEFGIQSRPDPVYGVSQTRQAEYRAIGEKLAWDVPRVRAISQYLMRDDLPRKGSNRYGGFESGLRTSSGRAKLAYKAFRLPLVARRSGRLVRLWGLVRPHDGAESVDLQYRNGNGAWRHLKRDRTGSRGYWTYTTRYRSGRSYRVRWTSPSGTTYVGSLTRPIRRP